MPRFPKGYSRFSGEVERREYWRQYHQKRRRDGYDRDQCPTCTGTKHRDADRCRACHNTYRIGQPHPHSSTSPKAPSLADCHYCGAPIRLIAWHGRTVARCGGCGLETTPGELKRIASESRIEEAA